MYYLRSRYYNALFCRLINADPIISKNTSRIGKNLFAYCSNNSLFFSDESGNEETPIIAESLIGLLGTYNELTKLTKGLMLEVHHLIEKRFIVSDSIAEMFGSTGQMPSVILDHDTHRVMTNAWRTNIPYGSQYKDISYNLLMGYAAEIYGGFDHWDWVKYLLH